MIGFVLSNTLSDNGDVTRGICQTDESGMLTGVVETYQIKKTEAGVVGILNGKETYLDLDSLVSMNMWCFTPEIFEKSEAALLDFLKSLSPEDIKKEHVLPTLIGDLLSKNEINVKVMSSKDSWAGVTYAEDKPYVMSYFKKLIEDGVYPPRLY